jgi:hypothetical protein
LTLDQNALRDPTVFNGGLDNCNRVIFNEVMDADFAEMVLLGGFMDGLLIIRVKS